jgi:hypothetical protein
VGVSGALSGPSGGPSRSLSGGISAYSLRTTVGLSIKRYAMKSPVRDGLNPAKPLKFAEISAGASGPTQNDGAIPYTDRYT